jgi:hypothetical protein
MKSQRNHLHSMKSRLGETEASLRTMIYQSLHTRQAESCIQKNTPKHPHYNPSD